MVTATEARLEHFKLKPQGLIPVGLVGLYGPPGSVKSSIAVTWPKPMVYYDFDRGLHRAWGVKLVVGENGTTATYFGESGLIEVRYPSVPARSLTTRFQKLDGWYRWVSDFNQS